MAFTPGIEDMFKSLKRVCSKGAENGIINIDRLYMYGTLSGPACFPNVDQFRVTADDAEAVRGVGHAVDRVGPWLRQDRGRTGLALRSYRLDARTDVPKPELGGRTCTAAAHSAQVGFEQALLQCRLGAGGQLTNTRCLTMSWASELIDVVKESAVSILQPVVLVDSTDSKAFLIVLESGRCVWGWPLRPLSVERKLLVVEAGVAELVPIVIDSPPLGPGRTGESSSAGFAGEGGRHDARSRPCAVQARGWAREGASRQGGGGCSQHAGPHRLLALDGASLTRSPPSSHGSHLPGVVLSGCGHGRRPRSCQPGHPSAARSTPPELVDHPGRVGNLSPAGVEPPYSPKARAPMSNIMEVALLEEVLKFIRTHSFSQSRAIDVRNLDLRTGSRPEARVPEHGCPEKCEASWLGALRELPDRPVSGSSRAGPCP